MRPKTSLISGLNLTQGPTQPYIDHRGGWSGAREQASRDDGCRALLARSTDEEVLDVVNHHIKVDHSLIILLRHHAMEMEVDQDGTHGDSL